MMDSLEPLNGTALLVVAEQREKDKEIEARLPSWGGRFWSETF